MSEREIVRLSDKLNKIQSDIVQLKADLRRTNTSQTVVSSSPQSTSHNSLNNVQANQHHTKSHATAHRSDGTDPPEFDKISFDIDAEPTLAEGEIGWNSVDHTLDVKTDVDTTVQVGQEVMIRGINKTGGELTNGTVIYINGGDVPSDRPTFTKADASTWEDSQLTLGLATHDIANDAEGFATIIGMVRDINTAGMSAGDRVYLSETAGEFTTTRPVQPAFLIELGIVIKVDASEGIILVDVTNAQDYGYFNGSFVESFNLTVSSNGSIITASLERSGGGNLTMRFGTGPFTTLVTAPMTKVITAGSATVPKENFLYILESDQTQMTLSASGYPTTVDHIKVAKVIVLTAGITQTDDALANQNVNDHAIDLILMGHNAHLGEWIRSQPASYVAPGIAGNSQTGDDYLEIKTGPDAIYFRSTAGTIRQLHLQTYPAKDTEPAGGADWIYVVNDPDAAYTRITELIAGIDKLSTGTPIGNNKYFAVVFFGLQNKSGETSQLMCNLPAGQYNSQLGAENDINGYTNVSIPDEFKSTGFLICKLVIQLVGSTWVYKSTLDLRGSNPSILTGAGGGSAIVSFPDNTFDIHDSDDPTKEINFQASGISPGTIRNIIMPDNDVTLLTTAEKAALHAAITTLTHTALTGKNDEADVKHLTDAQVTALHAAITTLTHTALTGKNDEADVKHLTDAQVTALHAKTTATADLTDVDSQADAGDFLISDGAKWSKQNLSTAKSSIGSSGVSTIHSDISNAGSGAIITDDERTALAGNRKIYPFVKSAAEGAAINFAFGSTEGPLQCIDYLPRQDNNVGLHYTFILPSWYDGSSIDFVFVWTAELTSGNNDFHMNVAAHQADGSERMQNVNSATGWNIKHNDAIVLTASGSAQRLRTHTYTIGVLTVNDLVHVFIEAFDTGNLSWIGIQKMWIEW